MKGLFAGFQINTPAMYPITPAIRGCASRSPEASQTHLGRVKAICDLARLASGIIVVLSVFKSLGLGSTCFRLCTAWHVHTMFTYVYGTTRIRCLTYKLQHGTHTHQCIVLTPERPMGHICPMFFSFICYMNITKKNILNSRQFYFR